MQGKKHRTAPFLPLKPSAAPKDGTKAHVEDADVICYGTSTAASNYQTYLCTNPNFITCYRSAKRKEEGACTSKAKKIKMERIARPFTVSPNPPLTPTF